MYGVPDWLVAGSGRQPSALPNHVLRTEHVTNTNPCQFKCCDLWHLPRMGQVTTEEGGAKDNFLYHQVVSGLHCKQECLKPRRAWLCSFLAGRISAGT